MFDFLKKLKPQVEDEAPLPELLWLEGLGLERFEPCCQQRAYDNNPVVVVACSDDTIWPKFRFRITDDTYSEPILVLEVYNNHELKRRVEHIAKQQKLLYKLRSAEISIEMFDAETKRVEETKKILDGLMSLDS